VPACPKCIIKDLCEYPDKTPAPALKKSDAPIAHKGATLKGAAVKRKRPRGVVRLK
jgi:hypothetical protein